jgi:hypothetical protein
VDTLEEHRKQCRPVELADVVLDVDWLVVEEVSAGTVVDDVDSEASVVGVSVVVEVVVVVSSEACAVGVSVVVGVVVVVVSSEACAVGVSVIVVVVVAVELTDVVCDVDSLVVDKASDVEAPTELNVVSRQITPKHSNGDISERPERRVPLRRFSKEQCLWKPNLNPFHFW